MCIAVRLAYARTVCELFVCSRSGIVFNPRVGAITDHSQSVKDINSNCKYLLYAEDPHRSISQLIVGLSLECSTLAYCIQFRGAQSLHAVDKTSVLDLKQ